MLQSDTTPFAEKSTAVSPAGLTGHGSETQRQAGVPRTKIDNLQILRAVAALLVVIFHTDYTVHGVYVGSFGVDIFFAISGFIMAMVTRSETTYFWRKRLIRIVPLYWTVTLLAYASSLGHSALHPDMPQGPVQLLKSLLFIPYARPDGSLYPVLVLGWTLNYEMCFYLLIGIALLVAPRHLVVMTGSLLVTLVVVAHLFPSSALSTFYSKPILLEFLGGMISFQIFRKCSMELAYRLRPWLWLVLPLSIAALVAAEISGIYSSLRIVFFGLPAWLVVQSTVLLSKSALDSNWNLLIMVGDSSYSLYLTHDFVVGFFRRIVGPHIGLLAPTRLPGLIATATVSVIVAIAVHRWFDRPVNRFLTKRFVNRFRSRLPVANETAPSQR